MRSWSSQRFLNPAESNDDGWFKFSIRKKPKRQIPPATTSYDIYFALADCSEKVQLDFAPYPRDYDGSIPGARERAYLESIEARRKKIRLFAKAVATFAEKLEIAFDEDVEMFKAELARIQSAPPPERPIAF